MRKAKLSKNIRTLDDLLSQFSDEDLIDVLCNELQSRKGILQDALIIWTDGQHHYSWSNREHSYQVYLLDAVKNRILNDLEEA